jgi:hypothetical protein
MPTPADYMGLLCYIIIAIISTQITVDAYYIWKRGRAKLAKTLAILCAAWAVFSVFGVLHVMVRFPPLAIYKDFVWNILGLIMRPMLAAAYVYLALSFRNGGALDSKG